MHLLGAVLRGCSHRYRCEELIHCDVPPLPRDVGTGRISLVGGENVSGRCQLTPVADPLPGVTGAARAPTVMAIELRRPLQPMEVPIMLVRNDGMIYPTRHTYRYSVGPYPTLRTLAAQ